MDRMERFIPGRIQFAKLTKTPMQPTACYWNADAMAAKFPALRVVHGWLVSIWPGLLVEYMHHALVMKPDKTLIDPTSYPYGKASKVSFVADESIVPSRDTRPFIYNRYLLISSHPDVRALAEVSNRQSDVLRTIAALALKQGIQNPSAETPVMVTPDLQALDAHLRSEVDRLLVSLNGL